MHTDESNWIRASLREAAWRACARACLLHGNQWGRWRYGGYQGELAELVSARGHVDGHTRQEVPSKSAGTVVGEVREQDPFGAFIIQLQEQAHGLRCERLKLLFHV